MVSSDRITLYCTYTRRESFVVDGKAEGIYIYHLGSGFRCSHYATRHRGGWRRAPSTLRF